MMLRDEPRQGYWRATLESAQESSHDGLAEEPYGTLRSIKHAYGADGTRCPSVGYTSGAKQDDSRTRSGPWYILIGPACVGVQHRPSFQQAVCRTLTTNESLR
eukprot:scaffold2404_cov398-Prasinococcus_capsulatus_cf.AAC.26